MSRKLFEAAKLYKQRTAQLNQPEEEMAERDLEQMGEPESQPTEAQPSEESQPRETEAEPKEESRSAEAERSSESSDDSE